MITSRSGATRLPRVTWRRAGRRSLRTLLDFIGAQALGDASLRERQIEEAIELLRYAPLRCVVAGVKDGQTFRRLTVMGRFIVYYTYTPPRGMTSGGTISVRAVKHAGSENPFLGVRDPLTSDYPLGVLTTRDSTEPATA